MSACWSMNVVYKYHQWLPLKMEEGFPVLQQQEQWREMFFIRNGLCSSYHSLYLWVRHNPGSSHWTWSGPPPGFSLSPVRDHILCNGSKRAFFWTVQHFLSMLFKLEASATAALLGEIVFWGSWFEGQWGCTFLQVACDHPLYICHADKAPAAQHYCTIIFLSTPEFKKQCPQT